ncbi:MAG TPA: STAS domain-containing protein [Thermoguttaceae bacterium]|nr:STAS domain-containing protein [Thermoguttaceae bacterium]
MIRLIRQSDVTIIELGPSYESLDDETLEEIGGLLLTKATVADPPRVVLDLSKTTYLGSTFIELLVRAWKRLRERGGTLALCGLQPYCQEVLRISRLDTLFEILPTRDQAVVAANKPIQAEGRR